MIYACRSRYSRLLIFAYAVSALCVLVEDFVGTRALETSTIKQDTWRSLWYNFSEIFCCFSISIIDTMRFETSSTCVMLAFLLRILVSSSVLKNLANYSLTFSNWFSFLSTSCGSTLLIICFNWLSLSVILVWNPSNSWFIKTILFNSSAYLSWS